VNLLGMAFKIWVFMSVVDFVFMAVCLKLPVGLEDLNWLVPAVWTGAVLGCARIVKGMLLLTTR